MVETEDKYFEALKKKKGSALFVNEEGNLFINKDDKKDENKQKLDEMLNEFQRHREKFEELGRNYGLEDKEKKNNIVKNSFTTPAPAPQPINNFTDLFSSNNFSNPFKNEFGYQTYSYTGMESAEIDRSNYNFSGKNLIGTIELQAASRVAKTLKEFGGSNHVIGLKNNLKGVLAWQEGSAWCAAADCLTDLETAKQVEQRFGVKGVVDAVAKTFDTGVINRMEKFKEQNAFIGKRDIDASFLNTENLIGLSFMRKREGAGNGHTGRVVDYDENTGDLYVLEGNLAKTGGKMAVVKYNMNELLRSKGDNEFLGFGDMRLVIKNNNPMLYSLIESKSHDVQLSSNTTLPYNKGQEPYVPGKN